MKAPVTSESIRRGRAPLKVNRYSRGNAERLGWPRTRVGRINVIRRREHKIPGKRKTVGNLGAINARIIYIYTVTQENGLGNWPVRVHEKKNQRRAYKCRWRLFLSESSCRFGRLRTFCTHRWRDRLPTSRTFYGVRTFCTALPKSRRIFPAAVFGTVNVRSTHVHAHALTVADIQTTAPTRLLVANIRRFNDNRRRRTD